MLNFTVGPVMSSEEVLRIGAQQTPYFRTTEFSDVMLENEKLVKRFAGAEESARVVFITGSGTASMEATVMNVFTNKDRVLVINGGGFGARFVKLCQIHGISYSEIIPKECIGVTREQLEEYDGQDYTGFLVNIDETSVGVLYDIEIISEFCRRNNLFLVVDSISSFLCDPLKMEKQSVDVLITGSQKALACPPGISLIVLSERAIRRVEQNEVKSLYFDLKDMLKNGERGQTPFTPAVSILLQIHARLKEIEAAGGVESEIKRISALAKDFRNRIVELPFEIASKALPNAVTPLHPLTASAYEIFLCLKDEYDIWVCPNGGDQADALFRVGHIGALSVEDNICLVDALKDMQRRGLI